MGKVFKVTFFPQNKTVPIEEEENLLKAALKAGVYITASCGGEGTCGKCRIIVRKGKIKQKRDEKHHLTQEEIKQGYALACLSYPQSDLEARIPVESLIGDKKALTREIKQPICGLVLSAEEWKKYLPSFKIEPSFKKVYLELSPPTLEDTLSDLRRLRRSLKREIGLFFSYVDLEVLRKLPRILRESNWRVTLTLFDHFGSWWLVEVEPGDTRRANYGVAIDLGTTTIVGQLVDLMNGNVIVTESEYNAQMTFGDDVISRIIHSLKGKGLKELHQLVVETINKIINKLVMLAKIEKKEITSYYVAGNTIMLHFLFGISPRFIREEPYIPATSFSTWVKAEEIGIGFSSQAYLYALPSVASYIGADIVGGILSSGMFQSQKIKLYIDIGTNGELVLGNFDWLVACSCSAGPAFEGGGIKHGMRAAGGAIEQVRISPETYEPMILTIGGKKPIGLCGSGLIDTLAELFLSGLVDRRGKFNLEAKSNRIREGKYGYEYVLVWSEDSGTGKDIVLTEVDVDNLMRAKAAVFAGIRTLVNSVNISFKQIDEVLIAGAFGNYLDIERAIILGLLPDFPCDKFKFLGNGSLHGAYLTSVSKEMIEEAEKVAKKITYLELSTSSKFYDEYVSALFLPHTNTELFPTVDKLIAGGRS